MLLIYLSLMIILTKFSNVILYTEMIYLIRNENKKMQII